MDVIQSLLPLAKGYLPYYMLSPCFPPASHTARIPPLTRDDNPQLSLIAVGNALQNYLTLHYTRRLYNGLFVPKTNAASSGSPSTDPEDATDKLAPADGGAKEGRARDQVTPLAARLFGTYTLISAVVRIYASYHLRLAPVYQMALWTYVVALVHFASEFFVYKTTRFGTPVAMPFFFATVGVTWMVSQYGFYVES
ncbi:hypothetical protein DL771_010620 [Monosporascus sp. 5C6A]|nr:hypothetical protein DL771_010620 [Monosporascus sp. 5C6A]